MFLFSACLFSLLLVALGQVKHYTDDMKSFSHAQKEGKCSANKEVLLFERNEDIPGVVTEQWFTGTGCFANNSIIRYYIDGEELPSIQGYLYMMHGIGFDSQGQPWGTKWVGQLARDGGVYNTIRMPYQKNIRVTLESKSYGTFWFILRGVENYPVIVGDLQLPVNARLRLQTIEQVTYPPYQYILLANSKKSGMLFMASLAGESTDFNYLEGCYRVLVGNDSNVQYLSSGTEDFFLSAYYYNEGAYHTDHAGLTYLKGPGSMSAYKIFASDPILFKDSFHLIWRIGEKNDNNCYKQQCFVAENGEVDCVLPFNQDKGEESKIRKPMFANTRISSYVWFYEW